MSKTIHLSLDNDDDGDNDAHDVVLMIIMIKLVTMIPHAPNIFLMLMFMIMLPLKFMWCPLSRFDCGWPRQQSPGRAQTWVIANRRDLKRPDQTTRPDAVYLSILELASFSETQKSCFLNHFFLGKSLPIILSWPPSSLFDLFHTYLKLPLKVLSWVYLLTFPPLEISRTTTLNWKIPSKMEVAPPLLKGFLS